VEDNWWPQAKHHAGDQFKTANGDWIVWINENCYQVANSNAIAYTPGTTLSQTICHDQSGTAAR
jgi:hypothetical protein